MSASITHSTVVVVADDGVSLIGSDEWNAGHTLSNVAASDGTLAQFAATTSLELKGVISDETGSGALVFATGPTMTLTNATALPDGGLTLTDVTTNNVSTSKHGFAPKLPNDDTVYLDGKGGYTTPPGSGGSTTIGSSAIVSGTAGRVLYETAGNVFGEITGATSNGTALTLVAPVLGTPASGTLTNCTGTAAGLTAGVATVASTVTVADAAGDATTFPLLAGSATGNLPPLTDAGLSYDASTNTLTAGFFVGDGTGITGITGGSGAPGMPCGRLTLTTAVPVTTSDVTAATNIYYTPYVGNNIPLWNGSAWVATIFTQVTLALGTISSGKPYDVFGFLNTGALNTELLAWTDDTTRATAITLQDGMYCKSGDHTRLYLGTFRTTATTTTEDSVLKRFVWNMYNQVSRLSQKVEATSHSYSSSTGRNWNNATTQCECVLGLGAAVPYGMFAQINDPSAGVAYAIWDWTSGLGANEDAAAYFQLPAGTGSGLIGGSPSMKQLAAGYHALRAVEAEFGSGSTFSRITMTANISA